jgi:hypothetical protein
MRNNDSGSGAKDRPISARPPPNSNGPRSVQSVTETESPHPFLFQSQRTMANPTVSGGIPCSTGPNVTVTDSTQSSPVKTPGVTTADMAGLKSITPGSPPLQPSVLGDKQSLPTLNEDFLTATAQMKGTGPNLFWNGLAYGLFPNGPTQQSTNSGSPTAQISVGSPPVHQAVFASACPDPKNNSTVQATAISPTEFLFTPGVTSRVPGPTQKNWKRQAREAHNKVTQVLPPPSLPGKRCIPSTVQDVSVGPKEKKGRSGLSASAEKTPTLAEAVIQPRQSS